MSLHMYYNCLDNGKRDGRIEKKVEKKRIVKENVLNKQSEIEKSGGESKGGETSSRKSFTPSMTSNSDAGIWYI